MNQPITLETVESKILLLRKQQVLLDSDVADLYGVKTRDVNKAVKNNPKKFPEGYLFELTASEKRGLVENFHRFNPLKHSTVIPKAFTEKGLYMLATILKSKRATQTTLSIIETFSQLRDLTRNIKALSLVKDEEKQKILLNESGKIITHLFGEALSPSESETSLELNFAVLKLKHTIKKKKESEER